MAEINPKKYLGQHFLASEVIAQRIAKTIPSQRKTLEIGPGLGALTDFLVSRTKELTLVEIDSELVKVLGKKFKHAENVEIKQGDCLYEDYSAYEVVCGLLPYNISSQIIDRFCHSKSKIGIFVVQKELAQRMVAGPGSRDYSRFSVLVQNNSTCKLLEVYPSEVFWPAPQVYSALVKLVRKKPLAIDQRVVDALFQHKNQKVKKALKHSVHLLGEKAGEIIEKNPSLAEKRVVELTLKELATLS